MNTNHVREDRSAGMSPPAEALWLIKNGFFPIRLDPKSKGTHTPGWNAPTEKIAANANLDQLFPRGHNLGVLTGDEFSNGLRDIDLDCPESVTCAAKMLPTTGMVWGKNGERRHYGYRCVGLPTQKFRDPNIPDGDERSMLVEIRGDGLQTMVPPSVHPDGGTIQWASREYPPLVDAATLHVAVKRLAAAALLARCWPGKGSRHAFTLAMAGWLSQYLEQNVCLAVVGGAARAAGCGALNNKAAAIRDTYVKLEKDQQATGLPTAKSLSPKLTQDVIKRLEEWLDIKHIIPSLSTSPASAPAPASPSSRPPLAWVTAAQIAKTDYPVVEWYWEGWLPVGGSGVVHGPGRELKSLIALALCLSHAAGRNLLTGEPMKQGASAWIAGPGENAPEEDVRRVKALCGAHGIDLATLPFRMLHVDYPLLNPADQAGFEQLVQAIVAEGITMLGMDSGIGRSGLENENDNPAVRHFMATRIVPLARRHGCTPLLVAHAGKPSQIPGSRPVEDPRGAGEWKNAVEVTIAVRKILGEPDTSLMKLRKMRRGRHQNLALKVSVVDVEVAGLGGPGLKISSEP
jgi:hypothetical protein